MRAENRDQAIKKQKQDFLESYFSLKNQFLGIEKIIVNDFQKYSDDLHFHIPSVHRIQF